jgi:hypothetical protein
VNTKDTLVDQLTDLEWPSQGAVRKEPDFTLAEYTVSCRALQDCHLDRKHIVGAKLPMSKDTSKSPGKTSTLVSRHKRSWYPGASALESTTQRS